MILNKNQNRIVNLSILLSLFTGVSSVYSSIHFEKANIISDVNSVLKKNVYSTELVEAISSYLSEIRDVYNNENELSNLINHPKKHIFSQLNKNKSYAKLAQEYTSLSLASLGRNLTKPTIISLGLVMAGYMNVIKITDDFKNNYFNVDKYYSQLNCCILAGLYLSSLSFFQPEGNLQSELDIFISYLNIEKNKYDRRKKIKRQ